MYERFIVAVHTKVIIKLHYINIVQKNVVAILSQKPEMQGCGIVARYINSDEHTRNMVK